ncbi:GNAT family protein [Thalassotalea ponticola]|uniref:GNAT family N-acetyltransferase n=1 Tax=Thalassotalea ponticola TaxID=1523392 RepID=UPI0025B5A4A7|nr:GNAT family protein [Thalassotalea ponticola]MDN3653212.1 GNAT family protein [Thalassotalea ponticola]
MTQYHLPTLETERLVLRPGLHSDWPFIYRMQSDVEQMAHIRTVRTDAQLKSWFVDFAKPFTGQENAWVTLTAVDKQSERPVGYFCLRIINMYSKTIEIGYQICKFQQRRGYASEGALATKTMVFERWDMHKVYAYCNQPNVASWKVMERIGLRKEGLLAQDYRIGDTWHNTLIYGEVNPKYKS